MDGNDREYARSWLAADGVVEISAGVWTSAEEPDARLTACEVAHEWAQAALNDSELEPVERLRLGFGMLDLLDEFWVTAEIGFMVKAEKNPQVNEALWDAYRRRLEAPQIAENVSYSLWVDWFENHATVETAFAEVLGADIGELQRGGRLDEITRDPLIRRVRRVLEVSGPVPWTIKLPVHQAVAGFPELHPALFRGLLLSYHDVYGDLEPRAALALLERLELPPGTEHLATLSAVLREGHTNHYRSPGAWDHAKQ
ncbi:hypothetical protein [Actinocorallia populi]|uniref:hypothetical protein n=1 Tax=Actinocorallia populi TaxID=2079200 RepID=UPI000D097B52|nr:hypothetical protein [Actinocorallia populi]